jgi:hypothetical protein
MKRGSFKRKPYKWKKRETPRETKNLYPDLKKEKKNLFPKKKSKTEEWNEIRKELKEKFALAGILSCELRYERCTLATNFGGTWSFAHSRKRRNISMEPEQRAKEMREVIYTCGNCHNIIETLPSDAVPNMYDIVIKTISERQ